MRSAILAKLFCTGTVALNCQQAAATEATLPAAGDCLPLLLRKCDVTALATSYRVDTALEFPVAARAGNLFRHYTVPL